MNLFQVRISLIALTIGDWVPFVPAMRPFLQLKSMDGGFLKREMIQMSDIEFVTDKIIKVSRLVGKLTLDGCGRSSTIQSHCK